MTLASELSVVDRRVVGLRSGLDELAARAGTLADWAASQ